MPIGEGTGVSVGEGLGSAVGVGQMVTVGEGGAVGIGGGGALTMLFDFCVAGAFVDTGGAVNVGAIVGVPLKVAPPEAGA